MSWLKYVTGLFTGREERTPEEVEEERREVVDRLSSCAERYKQEEERVKNVEPPNNLEERQKVVDYYSELFDIEPEAVERDGILDTYEQILEHEDEGRQREVLSQRLNIIKETRLELMQGRKEFLYRAANRAENSDKPEEVLEQVNTYLKSDNFYRSFDWGLGCLDDNQPPEMPFKNMT